MDNIITKFITPEKIPLVIEPDNKEIKFSEFLNILIDQNAFFKKKLLKYGGILWNFPIQNVHDFVDVIEHLRAGNFIDYVGGDSPRKKIVKGIYTSTEAPPSIKIPLHNELSFTKNYPKYIYFYCDIPPAANGQTIISDARKVYQAIDEDVKKRFIEKRLLYVSRYPYKSSFMNFINKSHKSWIDVFETEDKQEVERKCHENEFSFAWEKNDWIHLRQIRPAVISHPQTQEKVWFNQAHLFDFNPKLLNWWQYLGAKILYFRKHTLLHEVFFADKMKISHQDLYHILDILDQCTVYFSWEKGDVLILDNILAMHGRATFKGKRRVLTAMTG